MFTPTLQITGTQPALILNDSATATDFLTIMVDNDPRVQVAFDDASYLAFGTASNNGFTGWSEKVRFASNGHITPGADNTQDLGSSAKRWRNIYTTDLHLSNDRGDWTVIEEEDYLTLRNNKTDKVYKLVMEEIE